MAETSQWATHIGHVAVDLAKAASEELAATIARKLALCETHEEGIAVGVAGAMAGLHMLAGVLSSVSGEPIETISLRDVADALCDLVGEARDDADGGKEA